MHILTGLLVAKLLRARASHVDGKGDRGHASPLFDMPGVITLVHALPGRCRFRLPVLVGQCEAGAKLAGRLEEVEGISSAKVSAATGTILVVYDAARLTDEVLAAAVVRLLGLEKAFSGKVEASLGREIRDWAKSLNVAVYQKTGGVLDARTGLLLTLALLGIRKLFAERSLALPAGFTLLWWAGCGLLRGGGAGEDA